MRIVDYLIAFFVILIMIYVSDLSFTTGRLITNVLNTVGISGEIITNPANVVIIVLTACGAILMVTLLIHIGKAIRRGEP
ncbi:MAG: hypothetical protein QXO22_04230 [Thermosphaera sp.]